MNDAVLDPRTEVSRETPPQESSQSRRPKKPSKTRSAGLTWDTVHRMVGLATDDELHPLLGESVSNGVLGVLEAGALGISLIGNGLAVAQGLDTKHAIKQVDRLLSNRNLQLEQLDAPWVRFVLGDRKDGVIALDWT